MKKVSNNKQGLMKLIGSEYVGKWVALSSDYKKVLGYSSNLVELEKKAGKNAVYTKGLSPDVRYSFYGVDKI